MIDPGRTFESSGPDLALYEWGGWMKFVVLSIILVNVLATPWGLAVHATWGAIGLAILLVMLKITVLGLLVVSIEAGFAKLRLLRNVDFLLAAIVLAALGGFVANL
jgi:formate hydrogenlyase subunit 4